MEYEEFLKSKKIKTEKTGFKIDKKLLNPILFEFQKDIILESIESGKFCIFADCGLGKTFMQLEWLNQILKKVGGIGLIFAPLCVNIQTIAESKKMGYNLNDARNGLKDGMNIINYEQIENINFNNISAIVLDESSILKSYIGKTKRLLVEKTKHIKYKLCCTATPSPNDEMEILNHSEYLGIMESNKALAIFYINDTLNIGRYKLKGHSVNDFKMWLRSWCVFVNKPSDYGNYDDSCYQLPKINENDIIIQTNYKSDDCKELFYTPEINATNYHKIRRETLPEKIIEIKKIINPNEKYIIWCETNEESSRLTKELNGIEIKGSDDISYREKVVNDFLNGDLKILISKPSIFGFGMNFQNINNMIFCGLSYSYESYYQAVRRVYRFGQKKEVNIFIILTNLENQILNIINQKKRIVDEMSKNMIFNSSLKLDKEYKMNYEKKVYKTEYYEIINGDCVEEIKTIKDNSIDFSIFSPPFANLYIYSDSIRDMGNCNNDIEFFEQFKFLIKELYRVIKENRLIAVHCKNLVNYIGRDGKSGLRDFRGDIIRAFQEVGFSFHSEVTIWKDPVVEMYRTKAHGLLYKQLRNDSSYSRNGLAEYLLMFRKWGEDKNPIDWKTKENFPLQKWQQYASPVWMDIKQTNVLNNDIVLKDSADEKHICPLQLDIIEKAVEMWSNPGDIVFSPFAGIGSEGYQSILLGRKFIGIELKNQYFEKMKEFLDSAIKEVKNETQSLFDEV